MNTNNKAEFIRKSKFNNSPFFPLCQHHSRKKKSKIRKIFRMGRKQLTIQKMLAIIRNIAAFANEKGIFRRVRLPRSEGLDRGKALPAAAERADEGAVGGRSENKKKKKESNNV